jgi:hypothetical protein
MDIKRILLLAELLCAASCQPKIYSFTAMPRAVYRRDSVHLDWKVRGRPTMQYIGSSQANPPGDSLHLLVFRLVDNLGRKDPARQTREVYLLDEESRSFLVMRMDSLSVGKDTLIGVGPNDPDRWEGVAIRSLQSLSDRPLLITHAGRTALLADTAARLEAWNGLPFGGDWEIRTALTAAEKKDHGSLPTKIRLRTYLIPAK